MFCLIRESFTSAYVHGSIEDYTPGTIDAVYVLAKNSTFDSYMLVVDNVALKALCHGLQSTLS